MWAILRFNRPAEKTKILPKCISASLREMEGIAPSMPRRFGERISQVDRGTDGAVPSFAIPMKVQTRAELPVLLTKSPPHPDGRDYHTNWPKILAAVDAFREAHADRIPGFQITEADPGFGMDS